MIAEMARSALTVLLAGLCFGAGLPVVYTLAITLWNRGMPTPGPDGTARRNPAAIAGAVVCFAVVIATVVIGVLWITRKSLDHYLGISVF